MSHRSCEIHRAVAGCLGGLTLLTVFVSCSAPDGSQLFKPKPSTSVGSLGDVMGREPVATVPSGEGGGPQVGPGVSSEGRGGPLGRVDAGVIGDTTMSLAGNPTHDAGIGDAGVDAAAVDAAPAVCVPRTEVCDGLDNNCDGRIDEGACADGCVGFALKSHGYMYCSLEVQRIEALDRCSLEGMRLAWIETPEENAQLVASIVAANLPRPQDNAELLTYIGGSDEDREGVWRWVGNETNPDGFQFWQGSSAGGGGQAVAGSYANWASTEPNDTDGTEDCAVLSALGANNRGAGNWDDRDCKTQFPFVCEAP